MEPAADCAAGSKPINHWSETRRDAKKTCEIYITKPVIVMKQFVDERDVLSPTLIIRTRRSSDFPGQAEKVGPQNNLVSNPKQSICHDISLRDAKINVV